MRFVPLRCLKAGGHAAGFGGKGLWSFARMCIVFKRPPAPDLDGANGAPMHGERCQDLQSVEP